ncbi:MAG: hypothetical protein ABIU95_04985 [Burkholderiales bacterium]
MDQAISRDDEDPQAAGGDEDETATENIAMRLARIDEYDGESLHHEDPLTAALGSVVANMLRLSTHCEQVINAALQKNPQLYETPTLQKAFNHQLNLAREVHRTVSFIARKEALSASSPLRPRPSRADFPRTGSDRKLPR